jgi:hypothetical protein
MDGTKQKHITSNVLILIQERRAPVEFKNTSFAKIDFGPTAEQVGV